MIPGLPNPYLILATVLALLGTFIAGNLHGHSAEKTAWEASTARLQAEAANTLTAETNRVRELENQASAIADKVETAHVDAEKTLAAVTADYDAKLRGKRLRDQAGRAGGSCPTSSPSDPAGSSPQSTPPTGCELSDAASDGLRRIALEADAFRLYAVACHEWAMELKR